LAECQVCPFKKGTSGLQLDRKLRRLLIRKMATRGLIRFSIGGHYLIPETSQKQMIYFNQTVLETPATKVST